MDQEAGRHPLGPASAVPGNILAKVPVWRTQWRELWYARLSFGHVVYRNPTRGDVVEHNMNMQLAPYQAIDHFVHTCLLYPEGLPDSMTMGEFMGLYRAMWETSGFGDPETFEERLSEVEDVVNSPDYENILILLEAFPALLPEQINAWQSEQLALHIALARTKLGLKSPRQHKRSLNLRERRKAMLAEMEGVPYTSVNPDPKPESKTEPKPDAKQNSRIFDWEADKRDYENSL